MSPGRVSRTVDALPVVWFKVLPLQHQDSSMPKLLSSLLVVALFAAGGCGLFKKRTPVNQTVSGTIAAGDNVLQQDNSLYDDYPIEVDSGWTIHATMTSSDFDTYLILVDPQGNRAAFNDDDASLGGNGTNSQVTHTATQSGTYHIYANSYQSGQVGAYQLAYQAGPAGAAPAAAPGAPVAPVIPTIPTIPAAPAAPAAPAPIAPAPAP